MGTGWFLNRDKASLDIFWLSDESLEASDSLLDPDIFAQEIVVPRLASLGTTRARAYGQAVSCVEGSKTLRPPSKQFREIATEKDQFTLRISYRSVFAVTCGLANRLCRRFVINAILPKILCF